MNFNLQKYLVLPFQLPAPKPLLENLHIENKFHLQKFPFYRL